LMLWTLWSFRMSECLGSLPATSWTKIFFLLCLPFWIMIERGKLCIHL
jgi:hypothetical protein